MQEGDIERVVAKMTTRRGMKTHQNNCWFCDRQKKIQHVRVHDYHERMDGSGYPRGLKGESILLEARILALVHALEDLTTNRSYRSAFPLKEALEEVSSHSGSKYDPDVVAACLSLFRGKGFKLEGI